MKSGKIFGYCPGCDIPLYSGIKLNESPCPEHANCCEFYCDACIESAKRRVQERKGELR
jgi:hypothetical protein